MDRTGRQPHRTIPRLARAFLGLAVLVLAGPPGAAASGSDLRFVVVGHLYPVTADEARFTALLEAIDAEEADHVFVLGDSSLEDPAVFPRYAEHVRATLHYVPGNHELRAEVREAYRAHVPEDERVVSTPQAHFVLVNTARGAGELVAFLDGALAGLERDRPCVLLGHHRIWDDTLLSPEPFGHDKSYPFAALFPTLEGRVDAIFAGNSRRQYFRDLQRDPSYGPQNLNAVYWCDLVGGIACYSVGTGDGRPKAGWVVVDVVDGELCLTPRALSDGTPDPPPLELVQPVRRNPFHSAAEERRLTRAMQLRYGGAGLAAGLVLAFLGARLLRRRG